MKRFPISAVLLPLVIAAALLYGCEEKGDFTILFTSDVKGNLVPAG